MNFSCDQAALARAINTVTKAVSAKTTMDVLKGIYISADNEGRVHLTCSDNELRIETTVNAFVLDPGDCVVVSRLFSEIIRKLPSGTISIKKNNNKTLNIATSSSEFSIICLDEDEFPKAPELEENILSFSIKKEDLYFMLSGSSFSASVEDSREMFKGVFLELKDNSLTSVALDGFRMAVIKKPVNSDECYNMLINSKIINNTIRILADYDDDMITVKNDGKYAVFILENTVVSARLMQIPYIDYNPIIPSDCGTRVLCNRKSLVGSIERASLLAREEKNSLVKLTVNDGVIIIESKSEDGVVKEEIPVNKEGNDIIIGFNSKYFLDAIRAIEDDSISIYFKSRVESCLIMPEEGDLYKYIVLPVRIS